MFLVLVNGVIWSDDRPFFDKLFENNGVYPIVYSLKTPSFTFLIMFLGKPWFWEKELLINDEVDGIVYDYMFPKAPVNRKHPCFQLRNYLTPCPYYAEARNRNTGVLNHPSIEKE